MAKLSHYCAVVTETSLMSMDVCVYSMADHMSKSNCIHTRAFIGMYWQQVNEHAVVCLCFQAVAHVFEWIRPVGMGNAVCSLAVGGANRCAE